MVTVTLVSLLGASVALVALLSNNLWERPFSGAGVGLLGGIVIAVVGMKLFARLNPRSTEIKQQEDWRKHPDAAPLIARSWIVKGMDLKSKNQFDLPGG